MNADDVCASHDLLPVLVDRDDMTASRARWWAEDPATLAAFRIVVATTIVLSPEVATSLAVQPVPRELWTPPEGLAWFANLVPIDLASLQAARIVVVVSALCGIAGWHAGASFAVLAASSFYLFAVPQLAGAVRHNMHLVWFAVLLAASPCGARWSLDARRPGREPGAVSVAVPIWAARLLLAMVYFFPGFWKLAESGVEWALTDNLRNIMYWKWYQNAWLPAARIDEYPALLRAGAAGVLAFELAFPLLLWSRALRVLAAVGGFTFHVLADRFMLLGFSSLWICYVVLVDWRWVVDWLHDGVGAEGRQSASWQLDRAAITTLVVSVALLVGNGIQGARGQMQGWPFACYPTFQWRVGTEMPDLLVVAVDEAGTEAPLLHGPAAGRARTQREWGIVWKVAGVYGPTDVGRLRAYYDRVVRTTDIRVPPRARELRFYRASYSVVPSQWQELPLRRTLLGAMPL